MEVVIYGEKAVDDLKLQVSLATVDDCMSFIAFCKEWNERNINHSIKGQDFKSIYDDSS